MASSFASDRYKTSEKAVPRIPYSPKPFTPHNTRNGELTITCGNRHCPKCQSLAKAEWLEKHGAQLLPVEYFHVVFTLPDRIGPIALQN